MTKPHDLELEQFKRTIDLTDYAKRAGYKPKPLDVGMGLTLLEHPSGDKIVVGQRRNAEWIYASVPDYEPRLPDESAEQARARLRASIERSKDKGTVVEFLQNRAGTDVSLDGIRGHLREFHAMRQGFDLEAAVDASALSTRDPKLPTVPTVAMDPALPHSRTPQAAGPTSGVHPELSRRRYDWTPEPTLPSQSDVEQRLERWRVAQAAIDDRRHVGANQDRTQARLASGPTPVKQTAERSDSVRATSNSAFGRCRLDWTPTPADREALDRAIRNRSPGRGR
jgi:hypothetical protein